ncbi:MAG TPA: DUF1549 and DUF1553 domain-containing protein [Verrucomicrobiales bacterium]|jgi:hypothetical protein|nr:DUF1549 and DUF1553 domain-containing protein [Verrucomicrobiales bacterium]
MFCLRIIALASLLAVPVTPAGERVGDAWSDSRNPVRVLFKGERLDLWSLRPVKAPALPVIQRKVWPRQDLDHFILSKLEAAGLAPAPEADRHALGRRLYFDLTGLPPSPEDIDAFVKDTAADAVDRLADRLIASPAFGEHWARWWMDLVRYSDSNGYDWDEFRPQAWRYRDYIVRSLKADKPLDRFLREQLAGDEMVKGAPQNAADQDCLIATGYLRIGPWDNSSKLFNEEHKTKAQWMADLTETTAGAFLGMTMTCCRCHDHKTEPLAQADHYRLRAFFEGTQFADDQPLDLAPEQEKIRAFNATVDGRVKQLETEAKGVLDAVRTRLGGKPKEAKVREALTKEEREKVETAEKAAKEAKKTRQPFTTGLCATGENAPGPARIFSQGDPDQPKDEVQPGIPAIFDPQPAEVKKPDAGGNGRRSALAGWLVSPQNPLTARVLANRLWQQCFGQGIVSTPGDFGWSGGRPSHPELLDFLAIKLVEDGWSLKKLVRRMVTSATYRQAAHCVDDSSRTKGLGTDASNTLLWHMNPRRLTAEQLRDAMLFVSGAMHACEGGPPRWPALPDEVLAANPAFYDDNETKTKGWYPSPPEKLMVRSLYLVQKRSVRVPFMETFDLPDNFVSCSRRLVSTVAPQAVTLLNNPFTVQMAQAFAARIEKVAGNDPGERITAAWRLALGRDPAEAERAVALRLLQNGTLPEFCRAVMNLNEFLYLD